MPCRPPGKAEIWAPGGAAVGNGQLFYAVGNGESPLTEDAPVTTSDSVLALTPQLTLADSFSPAQWMADNAADLDLGVDEPGSARRSGAHRRQARRRLPSRTPPGSAVSAASSPGPRSAKRSAAPR